MGEVENYVLKKEDFTRATKPDGTVVLTHLFLPGTIEWNPSMEPVPFLLRKFKAFSEKNSVLLSPEIARAHNFFEEGLKQMGREMDDFEEENFTD
ncbi:MAG TPA: hypothetical protein VHD55_02955 [Candidatus Paceibacterota bacterium]|nr:hypothetical protein [Candidatus Paceibacterota bacterium]